MLLKTILWASGMNKVIRRLQNIHTRRRKHFLVTLLISLFVLYLFHCIHKPHAVTHHWLNVGVQSSNNKTERHQKENISKYRVAFEPISVKNHVEWHAVFHHPTQNNLRLTRSQWTAVVELILKQFSATDNQLMQNASTPYILSTCVKTLAEHHRLPLSTKCSSVLERIMNVGRMPPEIINSPHLTKTFDQNNPVDKYSKIYLDPISFQDTANHFTMVNLPCDVVPKQRRSALYRLLQQWIRFADENKIMWWLSCGTLLGAVRDGNMIPYDGDTDISVLGSMEPKLRQRSTARGQIKNGQFNLVLRPGPHCIHSEGVRQNCYGQPVKTPIDYCAFCGPVARVFNKLGVFMDVFLLHLEIQFDDEERPIKFGYYDEASDLFGSDLHSLFPLRSCKFFGLDVPCPRDPATLLRKQYGKDFMRPWKKCHLARRH